MNLVSVVFISSEVMDRKLKLSNRVKVVRWMCIKVFSVEGWGVILLIRLSV